MDVSTACEVVERAYARHHGAEGVAGFARFLSSGEAAVLGYRRAACGALFLERYLDQPIETFVSQALGRPVERNAIVEIGNLAADNAFSMIDLWGAAANDLGASGEIAVATLTSSLRRQLGRVGITITPLAPALSSKLGDGGSNWGRYFTQDPWVCAGSIAQGQAAIAGFLARRTARRAA